MIAALPENPKDAMDWGWEQYEAIGSKLLERELNPSTIDEWMADWSAYAAFVDEVGTWLYIATSVDTTDEKAKERLFAFLEVAEKLKTLDTQLTRKLLDSGLKPDGMDVAMRGMRGEVELFREENLPIMTALQKLSTEYGEISGARMVEWDGEERTTTEVLDVLMEPDRERREQAWRLAHKRILQDREPLNALWVKMLEKRVQLAKNADKADYRAYMWQVRGRYDYSPADNMQFHESIAEVAVPAMLRLLEKRKEKMGLDTLRPWDMEVNPSSTSALKPFSTVDELIDGAARIFDQLDSQLSSFYKTMRDGGTLDLDNRKGKAPGGYCAPLAQSKNSFIFMNATGIHDNVQTLLHEAGHAFHNFEAIALPYYHQNDYPMEFAEVASMSMELLAQPYLVQERGGYYTPSEAALAGIEHLSGMIQFWCYMPVVDSFQHWVYLNVDDAMNPANCDTKWNELWDKFLPGVDWSGIEDVKMTGWQRKLHIYQVPFYYLEYGPRAAWCGAGVAQCAERP